MNKLAHNLGAEAAHYLGPQFDQRVPRSVFPQGVPRLPWSGALPSQYLQSLLSSHPVHGAIGAFRGVRDDVETRLANLFYNLSSGRSDSTSPSVARRAAAYAAVPMRFYNSRFGPAGVEALQNAPVIGPLVQRLTLPSRLAVQQYYHMLRSGGGYGGHGRRAADIARQAGKWLPKHLYGLSPAAVGQIAAKYGLGDEKTFRNAMLAQRMFNSMT